jgi:hypothetical protein
MNAAKPSSPSPIQDPVARIKELDAEKSKLIESAKSEALERAKQAVSDLTALGFSYQLTQVSVGRRAMGEYRTPRARFAASGPALPTMLESTDSPPRLRRGHSTPKN